MAVHPVPMEVWVGDPHIDKGAWPNVCGDSKFSFTQAVDWAIENSCKYVVLLGDNTESHLLRSQQVSFLFEQFDKLADNGIKVLFIQGNHDIDDPPLLSVHPAAIHLHRRSFRLVDGTMLYGFDYKQASSLEDELADIPGDSDILICHQRWSPWMGDIAHPQGRLDDVPVVSTIVSGDYHEYEEYEFYRGDQRVLAISPGSTCMRKINESCDKGFLVRYSDNSWSRVKFKLRPFFKMKIMDYGDMGDWHEAFTSLIKGFEDCANMDSPNYLPEDIRKPLFRLEYSEVVRNGILDILKHARRYTHVFPVEIKCGEQGYKNILTTGRYSEISDTGLVSADDLLAEVASNSDRPEVYSLAVELYHNPSRINEIVDSWRVKMLSGQ